jgi:hypothetical protein
MNDKQEEQVVRLTEQGDFGCGVHVLTEEEKEKVKQQQQTQK